MAHYLEISVASVCKLGCGYCPQQLLYSKNKNKKSYMKYENFVTVMNKLPKYVTIDFAGYVEPFLNDRTSDMIAYAYNTGFKLRLFTTLTDLRDRDIDILKGVKFETIVLHLPDEEGHMKAKVDDEYVRLAKRFKEEIGFNSSHCYGKLHPKLKSLFPGCVATPLEGSGLHSRAGNVETKAVEHFEYKKGPLVCGVVWRENSDLLSHNVANFDFSIMSCCCDYGLENKFGNLLTDEYEDLFKSEGYVKMKKAMASEDDPVLCRTCKEAYPEQPYK
jgi:MoaA/NifB/PqqE/SkfB family radical SAM enzyme